MRLYIGDHVRNALHGQPGIGDQYQGHARHFRDGCEILERVEAELVAVGTFRHQRIGREHEGIAVACGQHGLHGDDAAGAGLVLDDDGLLEILPQALRDGTRDHVRGTARGGGNHQADGALGPGTLRHGACSRPCEKHGGHARTARERGSDESHLSLPVSSCRAAGNGSLRASLCFFSSGMAGRAAAYATLRRKPCWPPLRLGAKPFFSSVSSTVS